MSLWTVCDGPCILGDAVSGYQPSSTSAASMLLSVSSTPSATELECLNFSSSPVTKENDGTLQANTGSSIVAVSRYSARR